MITEAGKARLHRRVTEDTVTHLLHQDEPHTTPRRTKCGKALDDFVRGKDMWTTFSQLQFVSCDDCEVIALESGSVM